MCGQVQQHLTLPSLNWPFIGPPLKTQPTNHCFVNMVIQVEAHSQNGEAVSPRLVEVWHTIPQEFGWGSHFEKKSLSDFPFFAIAQYAFTSTVEVSPSLLILILKYSPPPHTAIYFLPWRWGCPSCIVPKYACTDWYDSISYYSECRVCLLQEANWA